MENAVYSQDDKIDYYLHKIAIAPQLTLDPRILYEVEVLDEETCFLDQIMVEKGLIKIDRGVRVITSKGLEISNFGGWYMHQKLLRKENQRLFLESDDNIRKFQRENASLKKQLKDADAALLAHDEKDRATKLIIANLIRQSRSNRISLFLTGAVFGVLIAILTWILAL